MAIGAGTYDDECTAAREATKAEGCILIVVGGDRGEGFSCQSKTLRFTTNIPSILREVADSIDADMAEALTYTKGKMKNHGSENQESGDRQSEDGTEGHASGEEGSVRSG